MRAAYRARPGAPPTALGTFVVLCGGVAHGGAGPTAAAAPDAMAAPRKTPRVALLTVAALLRDGVSAPASGLRPQEDRRRGPRSEYWQANCIPISTTINDFGDMTRDEVAKSIARRGARLEPEAR